MRRMSASLKSLLAATAVMVAGSASAQTDLSGLSDEALLAELASLEAELYEAEPLSEAEQLPYGRVGAYLGYSSDFGPAVGVRAELARFLREGQSLSFNGDIEEHASHADLKFSNSVWFDGAPLVQFGLGYSKRDADKVFDFDTESSRVRLGASWELDERRLIGGYVLYSRDRLNHLGVDASPLIAPNLGTRNRQAAGIEYRHLFGGETIEEAWGQALVGLEYGRFSGGHSYTRAVAAMDVKGSFGDGYAWTVGVRAGALDSSGGESYIGDRFFLGDSIIRGFEYGGIGPRDLSTSGRSALGGERYAALRLDISKKAAFGLPESVTLGAFMDAGSLWKSVKGPMVEQGFDLRAVAGISVGFELAPVRLTIELSKPLKDKEWDGPRHLGVRLSSAF